MAPALALRTTSSTKTVIRAAYGIFYGGEENQGGNPNRGESAPFNESPQLNRPAGVGAVPARSIFRQRKCDRRNLDRLSARRVHHLCPYRRCSFARLPTTSATPWFRNGTSPFSSELPGQMALEVGYQGNHSSHGLLQPDFNTCPNYATLSSSIYCNSLRPVRYIGSISGTASFGFGNYDALTAKLEKKFSHGLQFITAYTYGHALANSGTTLSGSNGLYTKDPTNYATSYSSASWDIRHNFTTGFTYDIPVRPR